MRVDLDRILIVRNDGYTRWQNSSYIPERGEYAIGFWSVGNEEKPIIKLGDGKHLWKDLSQTEFVFTENFRLSEDFGKYKTFLGNADTSSEGKTFSEWFLDAYSEVKEPIITQPTIKINKLEPITNTGNFEIGSDITGFNFETEITVASYEYGSAELDRTKSTHNTNTITLTYNNKQLYIEEDITNDKNIEGTLRLSEEESLTREGDWETKNFSANIGWSPSPYFAVNNLWQVTDRILLAGGAQETKTLTIPVYREGCFFGGVSSFKTDDVDSAFIRGLQKTGEGYSQKKIRFSVPAGTSAVVIACPQDRAGLVSVLNLTAGTEMFNGNFKSMTHIPVDGAKLGNNRVNYKVWYYVPARAYSINTEFEITLG